MNREGNVDEPRRRDGAKADAKVISENIFQGRQECPPHQIETFRSMNDGDCDID
jgi:hypothetical protein